jgi:tetratricopeptide (TPR) repeat protein
MSFLSRFWRSLKGMFITRQPVRYSGTGPNVSVSAFVKETKQQGALTREEALERQRQILDTMKSSEFGAKISAAARLMLEGAPREAITAYEQIAIAHPDRIGECQAGIGAAHYFLGNYETAIEFYQKALANGADPQMMQDNVDEAEEAMAKQDRQRR